MMTNLIYDRTLEDVAEVRRLLAKLDPETGDGLTAAEQAKWDAGLKGAYNFTDLNRVEAAVKTLSAALTSAGYPVEVTPVLKGSSRVPAGYTEVEWIQSSGTQYIDTGFKPNQNTRIDAEVETTDTGIPYFFWGARTSSETVNFCLLRVGSGVRADYGESKLKITSTPSAGKVSVSQNKNVCTYGSAAVTNTASTFASQYPLYLFAANTGGTAGYFGRHKLYNCKIYNDGTLIRDFVPARNGAGAIGLYDMVNGVFYANKGTGSFTAGPETPPILEDREWQEGDVLYRSQWTTYLENVQRLRDAYYTLTETGELPKPEDKLGYVGANTIEKVLADIDLLIDCMKSSYRRCGTFRAGNNAAHLPLKGSI